MHERWPVLLMVRELGAGGSERQMTETARSLNPAEFEVHVACFRAGGMRRRALEDAGVRILALPVRSFYKPSAVEGALELRRYLREHSIQLVHTFDAPTNLFGVPVAKLAGTPVVLASQRAYRELAPASSRPFLRVIDRMADGVVVNCQAIARHATNDLGIPADRVMLCYNGIDSAAFHPAATVRQAPVSGAELVVGTVCGLREEKRLDLLVEAFARIAGPGRMLLVVGSGVELTKMEEISRRLKIREYCHFEPFREDVAAWLHSIDIFVLPSRSEALSNSLAEAMACGCAVVASGVGGNPELVGDRDTGLLFQSGDAQALAKALEELAGDAGRRREMGARAAARIAGKFSLEACRERMSEIYRERLRAALSRGGR